MYQNERERGTVGDEGKDAISGQITGNLVGYGGDFNMLSDVGSEEGCDTIGG